LERRETPPIVATLSLVMLPLVAFPVAANARAAQCDGGAPATFASARRIDEPRPLEMQSIGDWDARLLSPRVIELSLVTTAPPKGRPSQWDFAVGDRTCTPGPDAFAVAADGRPVAVRATGFRRSAVYAPVQKRDLRLGASLVLELAEPVREGAAVTVRDRSGRVWSGGGEVRARTDVARWSPAIHVDQNGYAPDLAKKAIVGRYLGSLRELRLEGEPAFVVVDEADGREAFFGRLARRPERGFTKQKDPYQEAWEADFTPLRAPGRYRVRVEGLGRSLPFAIDPGVPSSLARTFALGFYHQRCGAANELPFTRFGHGPCHLAQAEVPTAAFEAVRHRLAGWQDWDPKDQAAPQMKGVEKSLFPFVRNGRVDVRGGHHDAGDYSKYTTNSSQLIHLLTFAADAFPGVADLDNLGLPESGDGSSDLLQLARWEAEFLVRMQDDDGGFYYLVYPRDRSYEQDVLPDRGDPQVVFPKNTSVTAAAVAALAQLSSSPRFRRDFPADAPRYLDAARKGWAFLERAFARHGRHAAYQRIAEYGDLFEDDDDVAWAATELYLATGEPRFREPATAFDPADEKTMHWTWVRLSASWGNAIRSYAFADRMGRTPNGGLDPAHLARCRAQVVALGDEVVERGRGSAYRTSLPFEAKRFRAVGWYFSPEWVYDLAAAWLLDPRPAYLDAAVGNLDYALGANPLDVSFVPGLGRRWPRDVVSAYAMNDGRALPPTGVPNADVVPEFAFLEPYLDQLRALRFPSAGDQDDPYPFYDRWGDSFNTTSEPTVPVLARCLGGAAFLMARGPDRDRPWRAARARIEGVPERVAPGAAIVARLVVEGMDPSSALVVWEAAGREPVAGPVLVLADARPGLTWIEAEARWPDGRRAFARAEVRVAAEVRSP
jgi:hypothetical protein